MAEAPDGFIAISDFEEEAYFRAEAERERDRLKESLEALWTTLAPSKSKWIQHVLQNSKAAFERPLDDTENACLRKQVLAMQKDLALARKILHHISVTTSCRYSGKVALRCLKEFKQK